MEPFGDGRGEIIGHLDQLRPAPAVGDDLEGGHRLVALGEGHDVGDLGAPPLVDRLLVVADDANRHAMSRGAYAAKLVRDFARALGEAPGDLQHALLDAELPGEGRHPVRHLGGERDEALLGRVDVLVLVDDQVLELGMHLGRQIRALQLPHGPNDLQAVSEQPVVVKGLVVISDNGLERLFQSCGVKQFVLDDAHDFQEGPYAGKDTLVGIGPIGIELAEAEVFFLPGQEGRELVVVQYVIGLIPGGPLL